MSCRLTVLQIQSQIKLTIAAGFGYTHQRGTLGNLISLAFRELVRPHVSRRNLVLEHLVDLVDSSSLELGDVRPANNRCKGTQTAKDKTHFTLQVL